MAANMVVRTNVFALNAHRNMKNVGLQQRQASNRLSSGYRINSAADDAAGLAISETMRAQIRGLDQASRNAQDGQAMILTTEGGLEEIGNMLQRTRELLVQASNDTNTQAQRDMITQEIIQLGTEIGSMQRRVEFNTNRVLDMGAPNAAIATAQTTFSGVRGTMDTAGNTFRAAARTWETAQNTHAAAMVDAEALVSTARTAAMSTANTALNAARSTFNIALSSFNTATSTFLTGENAFRSAVVAAGSGSSGNFVAWFQVGANANQGIAFDFERVRRAVDVAGALVTHTGFNMVVPGSDEVSGIGFGRDISPMVGSIQAALDGVNSVRANLGALQNRMDYTMRSLDISSENLSDSESRVRNADVAREMMRFTMTNVLQQAAVSMLAQANQLPQNLLQLLR